MCPGLGNFNYHNISVIAQGESSQDSERGKAITCQVRSVNTEAAILYDNSSMTTA